MKFLLENTDDLQQELKGRKGRGERGLGRKPRWVVSEIGVDSFLERTETRT